MIVLFDGVCNLCSGAVHFIIARDPKARFQFSSLQSSFAQAELARHGIHGQELFSIILLKNRKAFQKSDAVLEIARHLPGGWPLAYLFKVIPRFIRDPVYDFIARNRYRWFGKKDACWLPTPALRARFID
jgi:predicted DCC family thiol-disulfide oxidoreductase YuxK